MTELQRLLDFARAVTHEAGRLTLGHFARSTEVIQKADGSPVTVADRDAEALILLREDRTVVGVVNAPALGEQLSAADGLGATLNGRPARVSTVARVEDAVLLATDHRDLESKAPRPGWRALHDNAQFTRSWGDAYGHLLVATGRAEIMLDPIVAPSDVACLPVILREAGGAFFSWGGEETIFARNAITVNKALEGAVREALGLPGASA